MKTMAARRLWAVLVVANVCAACRSGDALSSERAAAERAAIHHDLRNDTATLLAAAVKRVKGSRPELGARSVVCAISGVDIQFVSETRATYAVSYACGAAPWQPGRDQPVATPILKLDLLKEAGVWLIDGIL